MVKYLNTGDTIGISGTTDITGTTRTAMESTETVRFLLVPSDTYFSMGIVPIQGGWDSVLPYGTPKDMSDNYITSQTCPSWSKKLRKNIQ